MERKKHGAARAARGRQPEMEPYSLRSPEISEKLQLFVELAADIEQSRCLPAVEQLHRLMSVDESVINSYKATLFEEAIDSLVDAEQRIMELEALVRALTEPKGRGRRRTPLASMANRIQSGVRRAQWIASVDGEELSQKQAVIAVLRQIHANDSNGNPLPEEHLSRLVDSKLEAALRTYRRANAATRPDK